MRLNWVFIFVIVLFAVGCSDSPSRTTSSEPPSEVEPQAKCIDGMAENTYRCENVDLLAHIPVDDLLVEPLEDGLALNDIWGWTDPETGIEYALVGLNDGVTFVDLTNPAKPVVVGKLKETAGVSRKSSNQSAGATLHHEGKSSWRDMKVYRNYMYVVSDAQPHGLQVFDLTRLRDVTDPPAMFSEDALYEEFGNAHNIAINQETGFAYVTGSNTYGGGLHIINIQNPLDPQFAGFHSDSLAGLDSTGYVHDTQCVVYKGPDEDYQGDEICMNSSETHLVIADVTDKQNTETIARSSYKGNQYAHQGWLTEDQKYFLLDDELDELHSGGNTRTYIWDVQDLDNPELINIHEAEAGTIDHNQYVKGIYVYQANYTSGLRIYSLENVASGQLEEIASFDTFPNNNRAEFNGAWSNYPYFDSGVVVVSDMNNGLFILFPNL